MYSHQPEYNADDKTEFILCAQTCQVSAWGLLLPEQYGTTKPSSLLTAMSKSQVFMYCYRKK
jgi:hypothetical protein